MGNRFFLKLVFGLLYLCCLANLYSQTNQSSEVNRLYKNPNGNQLWLDFFFKENLLDNKIITNLNYTIPITFTFKIKLYQVNFLLDEIISTTTITKTVEYDPWSKRYFLKNNRAIQSPYIKDLSKKLLSIQALPIADIKNLKKNKDYFYQLTLSMKSKNFYFNYSFINNLISLLLYPSITYKSSIFNH